MAQASNHLSLTTASLTPVKALSDNGKAEVCTLDLSHSRSIRSQARRLRTKGPGAGEPGDQVWATQYDSVSDRRRMSQSAAQLSQAQRPMSEPADVPC